MNVLLQFSELSQWKIICDKDNVIISVLVRWVRFLLIVVFRITLTNYCRV